MLSILLKKKAATSSDTASSGLWQLAMRRLKADRI
ncbi:MAG: hypothetical protein VXY56_10690, partial [Pseudomonadota bacterium]|nr:hypothetical protein [Pseudomonadota bacterium]